MRVLMTSQPGLGHFHPLVPLARELQAAGHEVAFAAMPYFCPTVEANGFRCFRAGVDFTEADIRRIRDSHPEWTPSESAASMWANVFAGVRAESSLPDLLAIIEEWQPDLLVRDLTEFAGWVAAERAGVPHAAFQVAAYRPDFHQLVIEPLNRLRESVGLPADTSIETLHRYLLLSPRPPSFQDPAAPLPSTAHAIRHGGFNRSGSDELPSWIDDLPQRPLVYATLGTVFNHMGLFSTILDALREEPVTVIMTVGRDQDPADFGPQPEHIHIERYIPQSLLLSRCDLVITHGGSGTVMDALSQGVPMVVIPIAADQPANARSCARLGVARVIEPGALHRRQLEMPHVRC